MARRDLLGVPDLLGPYRATLDTMPPDAHQIADPFHLIELPTPVPMRSAARSRTRHRGTGATNMTGAIGHDDC